jgi:hypothetical protein
MLPIQRFGQQLDQVEIKGTDRQPDQAEDQNPVPAKEKATG